MKSRILIVDDELAIRETIEAILDDFDYEIILAENGLIALEKTYNLLPDVILLDVMMPGLSGFDVCNTIRHDNRVAEIPIVMVSSLNDRAALMRGLEAGADDFILKPFDSLELRTRISGIVRLNRFRKLVEDRTNLEQAHKKLLDAYEATIEGWSYAMDLRARETEGHTQRVTEMTMQMARIVGMSKEQLVQVRRGALLHDMGKLGIPDHILLKPGKLTPEEWVIMRKHPQYAFEMLSKVSYLQPALDIPYCHHEKWDGSGYPRGIKGEEIPMAARLFCIVDVWDALTSDRPYRPAMTKEQTIEFIRQKSGTHFDPQVVELFLQNLPAILSNS